MAANKAPSPFDTEVQALITSLVALEKEEYHSDLVPFKQHAAQVSEDTKAYFSDLQDMLEEAKAILREHFIAEEAQDPSILPEARFECWEKCAEAIRKQLRDPEFSFFGEVGDKTIQEVYGLPWPFMDRAFAFGKQLFADKQYEEAKKVFLFLRFLQPSVFEYWFGEALSCQSQGNFQEAAGLFGVCLSLQPKNPLIYYQIGCCCYQAGEVAACLKSLEACLQYADDENINLPYVDKARKLYEGCASKLRME